MKLTYRIANIEDIPQIMMIVQEAIQEMNTHHIDQWDHLYPTKDDFLLDIQESTMYVGIYNDSIVTFFVLNHKSDQEYNEGNWSNPTIPYLVVHKLCVQPNNQNKGIALTNLSFIEEKVLEQGSHAIRLDVFSQNPKAYQLYTRCGFKKVGSVTWRKGLFHLMEKYL